MADNVDTKVVERLALEKSIRQAEQRLARQKASVAETEQVVAALRQTLAVKVK